MNPNKKEFIANIDSRDKIFKGLIKKESRRYRAKIKIDREAVKARYLETGELNLGSYRHFNVFVNYDYLCEKINNKFLDVNMAVAIEIVHSVNNKINDLLVECLLEAEKERHG